MHVVIGSHTHLYLSAERLFLKPIFYKTELFVQKSTFTKKTKWSNFFYGIKRLSAQPFWEAQRDFLKISGIWHLKQDNKMTPALPPHHQTTYQHPKKKRKLHHQYVTMWAVLDATPPDDKKIPFKCFVWWFRLSEKEKKLLHKTDVFPIGLTTNWRSPNVRNKGLVSFTIMTFLS